MSNEPPRCTIFLSSVPSDATTLMASKQKEAGMNCNQATSRIHPSARQEAHPAPLEILYFAEVLQPVDGQLPN